MDKKVLPTDLISPAIEHAVTSPKEDAGEKTMIDETLLLEKLLRVTEEEDDLLQWCFLSLAEHEIAACLKQAREVAVAEIRADDASALLTQMFVKVIVRTLRWTRLERQRAASKPLPEDASHAAANEENADKG